MLATAAGLHFIRALDPYGMQWPPLAQLVPGSENAGPAHVGIVELLGDALVGVVFIDAAGGTTLSRAQDSQGFIWSGFQRLEAGGVRAASVFVTSGVGMLVVSVGAPSGNVSGWFGAPDGSCGRRWDLLPHSAGDVVGASLHVHGHSPPLQALVAWSLPSPGDPNHPHDLAMGTVDLQTLAAAPSPSPSPTPSPSRTPSPTRTRTPSTTPTATPQMQRVAVETAGGVQLASSVLGFKVGTRVGTMIRTEDGVPTAPTEPQTS